MSTVELSQETVNEFRDQGATVLRGVFREWVEPLRAGVEKNLADPSPLVKYYTGEGNSGLFFGDYCNWNRIPEYRDFVLHSPVGAVGAELMGSKTVRFFHEHVFVKEPRTDKRTGWHQDAPYYSVDAGESCGLWIALDPVPREIAPEFIAGSHRWGLFTPTRFEGYSDENTYRGNNWTPENSEGLQKMPDIDGKRDEYTICGWELEPGDAAAFDFLTVHSAAPNPTANRRRAFSTRVFGDDARWAARLGPTSPPFPELSARLKAGDPLHDIEEFPVIFSVA
jgi:ectoine hydroxylase-related dioxygenase (phytanoyl-CoA dioxygenase family)